MIISAKVQCLGENAQNTIPEQYDESKCIWKDISFKLDNVDYIEEDIDSKKNSIVGWKDTRCIINIPYSELTDKWKSLEVNFKLN